MMHLTGYLKNYSLKPCQLNGIGNCTAVLIFIMGLLLSPVSFANTLVQGVIFNDENANGQQDVGEEGLVNGLIIIQRDHNGGQQSSSTNTNLNGEFNFNLEAGEYKVMIGISPIWFGFQWELTTPLKARYDDPEPIYTLVVGDTPITLNYGVRDSTQPIPPPPSPEPASGFMLDIPAQIIDVQVGEQYTLQGRIIDHDGCGDSGQQYKVHIDFGDGNSKYKVVDCASPLTRSDKVITDISAENTSIIPGEHTISISATDGTERAHDTAASVVRSTRSDPCRAGIAGISSVASGAWDDPNTWNLDRIPTVEDWVKIDANHTVTLPVITDPFRQGIHARGLCVTQNAVLQSAANTLGNPATYAALYISTINNQGAINGQDGVDGAGPPDDADNYQHATDGSHIFIHADRLNNEGTISAGDGGEDAVWRFLSTRCCREFPARGGTGGKVEILLRVFTNNGLIESGAGGTAAKANDIFDGVIASGSSIGGDGGLMRIMPSDVANSINSGTIRSGHGGSAHNAFLGTTRPGNGGNLEVNLGTPGELIAGGTGSFIWVDPLTLRSQANALVMDANSSITNTDDIFLVAPDGWNLELALSAGAIAANNTITIAVPSGYVLDLRGSRPAAIVAGQSVSLFVDNILLDDGISLETLIDAPNIIEQQGKTLRYAGWSGTKNHLGNAGNTLAISQWLLNMAAVNDSYNLSLTHSDNISVTDIPTEVTVNQWRRSEIEFDVTLPTTPGDTGEITLTATSQNDTSISNTVTITVSAQRLVAVDRVDEDNSIIISSKDQTLIVVPDGTDEPARAFLPTSDLPDLPNNTLRITTGKNLTEQDEATVADVAMQDDGRFILKNLTDPDKPLTVLPDGRVQITDPDNSALKAIIDEDGSLIISDQNAPDFNIVGNTDGELMITDKTAPNLTAIVDDAFIIANDSETGINVTQDKQGRQVVTHPEFPDMQGVINPDGTYSVVDATAPEFIVVVNPNTGNYQVIDAISGECYDDSQGLRFGLWRTIRTVASKAARFVGKVATTVGKVAGFVNKATSTVHRVTGFIISVEPRTFAWNSVLRWACARCHRGITNITRITANVSNDRLTDFANNVHGWSGRVATVAGRVESASSTISRIANGIADWLRIGNRAATLSQLPNSTCDVWQPQIRLHTASGQLLDQTGQAIADAVVQIGEFSTTTDAEGKWQIADLLEGSYTIVVSKDDYQFPIKACQVGNNEDCKVNIKAGSLLSLDVSINPRRPYQGDNVTYTLTIRNQGHEAATNISLDLQLPADLPLVTSHPDDNISCSTAERCTLTTLESGATAQLELEFNVQTTQRISSTFTLQSDNYPTEEVTKKVSVIPYFSVERISRTVNVTQGDEFSLQYRIAANPNAPEAAQNVQLRFEVARGYELLGISGAVCDRSNLPTVTCELGEIAVGSSQDVQFDMRLADFYALWASHWAYAKADNYAKDSASITSKVLLGDALVDIVIALDVTGSMVDELQTVEDVVTNLKTTLENLSQVQPMIAVVSFRDDIKLEIATTHLDEVVKAIRKLDAKGGGACPEASYEALALAVKHLQVGGTLILLTDAPPYADVDMNQLRTDINSKQLEVIVIQTNTLCEVTHEWDFQ